MRHYWQFLHKKSRTEEKGKGSNIERTSLTCFMDEIRLKTSKVKTRCKSQRLPF